MNQLKKQSILIMIIFVQTNDWFDVMNTRVYAADSRERVQTYGVNIDVQNNILDNMSQLISNMRVTGKNFMLPFQKGKNKISIPMK